MAFDIIEFAGNFLLFLLVFGMSATVDIGCLVSQLKNKKAICTGIFLQFFVLPLLGFLVVKILKLDEAVGVTLLVVTSSPGGSYSNWWCSMFNADLALSVTMTAISTLLSVIMLPLNLLLYAKYSYEDDIVKNLDWASLFIALIVVIGAIGLGLFCSAKINSFKFNVIANKLGNFAGIALVIFSATMSNTGGGDARMWNRDAKFYFGVAAPCAIGLLISNIVSSMLKLKKPERVTVSIECCYQNVGIATSVALTMFEGNELAEAMGVPLFYGLMEALILGIYCIFAWKAGWTKAPTDAPFWNVIFMSYEVVLAESSDLQAIEVTLSRTESDVESVADDGGTVFAYFNSSDGDAGLDNRSRWMNRKKAPSGINLSEPRVGNVQSILENQLEPVSDTTDVS